VLTTHGGASHAGGARTLSLLAASQFVAAADFTVVLLALPSIGRGLSIDQGSLQWLVTAYGLPFGGFLLLAGRLVDLLGRRRMFVVGHLIFGLASLLAAGAQSFGVIVVARAMQGSGAALLVPASAALLHVTFADGALRNRALSVWGAAGAMGSAVGVVAGGAFTVTLGWEAAFLVNIPFSAASLAAARSWLVEDPPVRSVRWIDGVGACCLAAAAALAIGALDGAARGTGHRDVLILGLATSVCLYGFLRYERVTADPLFPPRLLRAPGLVVAAAVTVAFWASLNNLLFVLTLHLQDVGGRAGPESSVIVTPYVLAIAGGTVAGARLTGRWGARTAATAGFAVGVAGVLALVPVPLSPQWIAPGLVAVGLGQGVAWTGTWAVVMTATDASDQGIASGAVSASGLLGQAVGLMMITIVLAAGPAASATAVGVRSAYAAVCAMGLVGLAAATLLPRRVGVVRRQPEASGG
jgi:MFS family permease